MAREITTAEELLRARDLGRCELVRGELRMMIPAGGEHGKLTYKLGFELGKYVLPRRVGTIYAAETGFLLSRNPDTVRAPDVAFVCAEREVASTRGFLPGAPDLAVEVLSPDDRPGYVREKVAEWLEAGARAAWVVDPHARTVTVHAPQRAPRVLHEADTLRGGDVLPGFALAVRAIFA
ncbi:MAG: Uma2 family endonuclease [Planctomycetota bacterium]|jgi:Uma2 family endonuclease